MPVDAFETRRNEMVDGQIIARGISNAKVIEAFRKIPRHLFVPERFRDGAYEDHPLPIGDSQTISQPYMVALMTELLMPEKDDRILEIGTGSGYQTAILAETAKEVFSVERFAVLAERAEETLSGLGYVNYKIKVGDGTLGWEEFYPYDAIVVTAGAPRIPESLLRQLGNGGRLVIPIGPGTQVLTLIEKRAGAIRTSEVCGCVFVPLVGKEGWNEETE